MNTKTWAIQNMRLLRVDGAVAEKNPDRVLTAKGDFFEVDEKGKPTGDPLSFHSKNISRDDLRNPATVVDLKNGILTLPAGERGRKASAGISADDLDAILAEARA